MRLNAVTIAAIINCEGMSDVMEKQSIYILMRRKKVFLTFYGKFYQILLKFFSSNNF